MIGSWNRKLFFPLVFSIVTFSASAIFGEVLYDKYGQSKKVDFPEKVKSDDELKKDIDKDKQFYASFKPPVLDTYGGLAGSKEKYGLKATGFFNVQKIKDRFILVTPEGNMYFALTVGGLMTYHSQIVVKGKENEFEWLPEKTGEFKKAYVGKDGEQFSFYVANLIRKYGNFDNTWWKQDFTYRLRQLGFNSHSAYGRLPGISIDTNFPITLVIQEIRSGDNDFISGFFDPFNEQSCKRIDDDLKQVLTPYKDRPEIIGYYIQNEPDFSFIPMSISKFDGKCAAKRKLVEMLSQKYKNIRAFNKAWELDANDFNDILAPICPITLAAGKDMNKFYEIFLDAYYKFVRDTVRKYDANHLLLGSRGRARDGRTDLINKIAGKYMDVISVNYYCYYFDKASLIRAHQQSGKPYILSEWCYDTREQGLMEPLRSLENQTQRGNAYRNYVEQATSLPFVVGVQWWCMLDHQNMNVNTGLVNVADRPYTDFLKEVVKTNHDIYSVMMEKRKPYSFDHPLFTHEKTNAKKFIDVPHSLVGMKVDGVQMPWPDRPSERLTPRDLVWGKDPGSNEADFWLCWDANNLYLYIDIRDNTPRLNQNTGSGIWRGDAVEIFIGQITDSPGLVFTDRQLLISAGKLTEPAYYWYNSPVQSKIDIAVKDSPSGQGCVIEAGIPFKAFGVKPKIGMELMFDIAIDDGDGKTRIRQYVWNGDAGNATTHENWGRAKLSE